MKKFIACCLVLLFLLPAQVFAHSKMTTSTPENNSTVNASPAQITMDFNTDIATLSTFIIENANGDSIPVDDITVEGSQLSGIPASTLENGAYNVTWTIIGADGHTVSDTYAFTVNAPDVVEPVVEEPEVTTEPTATQEPTSTPLPVTTTDPVIVNQDDSSPIIPIIIIALIIALGTIFATKRKKK